MCSTAPVRRRRRTLLWAGSDERNKFLQGGNHHEMTGRAALFSVWKRKSTKSIVKNNIMKHVCLYLFLLSTNSAFIHIYKPPCFSGYLERRLCAKWFFFPFAVCQRNNNSLLFWASIATDKKKNKVPVVLSPSSFVCTRSDQLNLPLIAISQTLFISQWRWPVFIWWKLKGRTEEGKLKTTMESRRTNQKTENWVKKEKGNQTVGRRSADLLLISSDAFHLE